MNQGNDAGYKLLFSAPEVVRDLVMGFIPDEWLHGLDYDTLEKMPGSYVTDDFRQRADDVVWRVKVDGEWVYLYLLIEFQSTVDTFMAVRMMVYVGLLYQDLIRRGEVLDKKRLPPILPIVLYNGDQKWTAATDIAELIPGVPGPMSDYLPQMKYLLIDENSYAEADLVGLENLMAAVIRFEHPTSTAAEVQLIGLLRVWLAGKPELRRIFAVWIKAVLFRRSKGTFALPDTNDLEELQMALAERFEEWAKEHEQKGIEKGIEKGEALILQRLLVRRFGALSSEVVSQVSTATTGQLETWCDRVLDAATLADVFRINGVRL